MPQDNIHMCVIKPEDGDKVVQFLMENFFPHAPIMSSEPKIMPTAEDRADILKAISHECSIMAVEDDHIVGVTIALPKNAACIDEYFAAATKLGNTKAGRILHLVGEITRDARIFERYGVETFLYLSLSSVAAQHRGRNIAARMTQKLIALGKELNYKVLTVDCSSFYCARVCERLGMECLNSVVYREYLDESGKPMFNPSLPHEAIKTYGQGLG